MKKILITSLIISLAANAVLTWQYIAAPKKHIHYREGIDASVEMKNMFDGTFSNVVLVHGYIDNHSVAEDLVAWAEETAGRPKGTFRVKQH